MTTIAKLKAEKLSDIESQVDEIIQTRYRVVEAVQLANEMKAKTDEGLSKPYHDMSLYYGRQRAILRGLTQSDIMNFDLPSVAEWTAGTGFTLPSVRKFGYQFVDADEKDSEIDDPSLHYLTRNKEKKILSTLDADSDAFSYPSPYENFSQKQVAMDSSRDTYKFVLNLPIVPNTLKVLHDGNQIGKDNGEGAVPGTNFASSIVDYDGTVTLKYRHKPNKGTEIKIVFDTYMELSEFEKSYDQIDFTLSQKVDFGQTLGIINIGAGLLEAPPELLDMFQLRRKSDHQIVGTIQVVCEGLMKNTTWDLKTGNPMLCLAITHEQFKTFLGYLSPDIDNDLNKSANPSIVSSGAPDGESYPNIEANPFFPYTDGTYIDKPPFTGNFVHTEEGTHKWSVHPDIKWQCGTAPAELGQKPQENPGTVLAALQAIRDFSGAGNNPIPPDIGNSTTLGNSYEMNGGFVWEYTWGGPEPPYTKTEVGKYSCYYNAVQQLKVDHLVHLQTQCGLIATLGNKTNTIETDRQSGDSQFVTDTATFKSALDTFLSYHDAFDPLTTRPTYDMGQITLLQTATDPSGYLEQVTTRLNDLDTTLGTATTSGYAKIIYDSCNMAAHMGIGYLRDVIDELNSIQDLYSIITDFQDQYSLLP